MKPSRVGKVALGVALLSIAMGSVALTLGRTHDVAWVGQSLDVQFQVQSDSVGDLLPGCLAAEVLYGDTQLESSRVSVSAPPSLGVGAPQSIRVQTSVPVDEPVVTVQLRVGCQQKLSKRYTFLAELPTNVVEPLVRSTSRSETSNARTAQGAMSIRPMQQGFDGSAQAVVAQSAATPAALEPVKTKGSGKAAPMSPPATKKSGGSRLKLDPLDLLMDRDPVLRASNELLTQPKDDGTTRTDAAALWRSMNVSPEQMLQDEARAAALDRDLKSLSAATAQNQKGLIELAGKVQQAESGRYANWLVYSLLGLWGASLLALLWLWRRQRAESASDWLHGRDGPDSMLEQAVQKSLVEYPATVTEVPLAPVASGVSAPASAPGPAVAPATATSTVPRPTVDIELDIDFDLNLSGPAAAEPAPAIGLAPEPKTPAHPVPEYARPPRDFYPSGSAALRSCESAELVDVREEAEFFVSLGQFDKAIDILTTRVAQFGESSPLVCLDLLRMYHDLGREAEFEVMRTEFNHWFAGYVPKFSEFGNDGRALEKYPQIMERISALWPSPEVLDYIEGCLYRQAAGDDGVVFDLQAYLDLLLLHGVAKQMVRHADMLQTGNKSEALRIPAPSYAAMAGDASQLAGGEAVPYRAGAQRRGSQFGALKYPPTTPSLESTTDLTLPNQAGGS
jgi:hypothetical protein